MSWGHEIRDWWDLDPEVCFLNHGSFGAVPKSVRAHQRRLQDQMHRQPVAFLIGAMHGQIREAMAQTARIFAAAADDVVFVHNATTGANAVLRSLDLQPGDAILTTTHAYGAVRQAMKYVVHRAEAQLVEVSVPFPLFDTGRVVEAVERALAQRSFKLAVFDHITSMTGLILPIRELVRACHAHGVPVFVDGAHVPGHLPVDVPQLGAEWYTGNLHKWAFAPRGTALLYARSDVQQRTAPAITSHGEGFPDAFDWPGTFDPTSWLSAPAALEFVDELGAAEMQSYNHRLATTAGDLLAEHWHTQRPAPVEMTGNLVTLRPPVDLPPTFEAAAELHNALLSRHQIEVPCFPFGDRVWVRISAQVYNELSDYEKLAHALTADGVR